MSERPPDIIWINGSFGVGKSTAAVQLAEAWGGAVVFDPEPVGQFVASLLPNPTYDFQDIPLWRELIAHIGGELRRYRRPVIVPMTLVDLEYFDEIVGSLRRQGVDVRHVTLRATRGTIARRLAGRPDTTEWTWAQIDRCRVALEAGMFAIHIDTDDRSVAEVVAAITSALTATREATVGPQAAARAEAGAFDATLQGGAWVLNGRSAAGGPPKSPDVPAGHDGERRTRSGPETTGPNGPTEH